MEQDKLRRGFTTGSCAAAAAKAAAYMLLLGKRKEQITIQTPKEIPYHAEVLDITCTETEASCAVRKDGGDDPDITTGILIYASVSYAEAKESESHIVVTGGAGIGKVTKPGLDQPVGSYAINHIPREMIEQEVQNVCRLADYHGCLLVRISAPDGEEIAKKTFNPRLGIEGGISILGTTGIVEPMSTAALLETIRTELRQKRAEGFCTAYISPGNYGMEFMRKEYGFDLELCVKCSNYIGKTIDLAREEGFQELLLAGHIGKLVKLAGGIMNTHSAEGDCRMELLAAAAVRYGADNALLKKILDCISTEEAIRLLDQAGIREPVMKQIMGRAMEYLKKRAGENLRVECIMFSNTFGCLCESPGAGELIGKMKGK